jgi:DNA-binding NarL/FixJ family response regulator
MTMASLTRREQQIHDMILQGHGNKVIGRNLGISPRTVEDHRSNIYDKMKVKNATALVHKVLSARIAELEAQHG